MQNVLMFQNLPPRQKIQKSTKYKVDRRKPLESFTGMFPYDCIEQNSPRETVYDRSESLPLKITRTLKNRQLPLQSDSPLVSSDDGAGGRFRVSPSTSLERNSTPEKRLPSVATVVDWREDSPEVIERDVAWNSMCKRHPTVSLHLKKAYYQRVNTRRKENADGYDLQNNAMNMKHSDPKTQSYYDHVVKCLTHSSDEFTNRKHNSSPVGFPSMQITKIKDLQHRRECEDPTPPRSPGSALGTHFSTRYKVNTPDPDYMEGKVEKLIQKFIPRQKAIHHKCKPMEKIYEPAYQNSTGLSKNVYKKKGLPSVLHKKTIPENSENHKTLVHFQSKVGNLGLVFTLYDFNANLQERNRLSPPENRYQTRFIPITSNSPL